MYIQLSAKSSRALSRCQTHHHNYSDLIQLLLSLQFQLHHCFGSKGMITLLNEHDYTASYDEVIQLKTSMLKNKLSLPEELMKNSCLISSWCDNYDLNVNTPGGNRDTHYMSMEFTQNRDVNTNHKTNDCIVIPKLSKTVMSKINLTELPALSFEHYQSSEKALNLVPPYMPTDLCV